MPQARTILTGVYVALLVLIALAVFLAEATGTLGAVPVITGIWLVSYYVAWQAETRPCTMCGKRVNNGVMDCPHCGFDFRSIGAPEHMAYQHPSEAQVPRPRYPPAP